MKLAKEHKFSENKQIFLKSLFFVLSIYLLINGIMFIWDSKLIVESVAVFSLLGVFLVATPIAVPIDIPRHIPRGI